VNANLAALGQLFLAEWEFDVLGLDDALTGLSNPYHLKYRAQIALAKQDTAVSFLIIGLDHFKAISSSFDDDTGDRLLLLAAQQLTALIRTEDIVARWGRDEFLILCEGVDANAAHTIAERIVHAFQQPFDANGHDLHITASVGIAVSGQNKRPVDLLGEADTALHLARERGGNQSVRYDPSIDQKASRRLNLEQALRRGLERDEFVLAYQPIHNVADGSLQGVEALVRWIRPGRGLVPPNEFITVAEYTGMIVPLGAWVLDEALRQLSTWKRSGSVPTGFYVSVNLSPVQLSDPTLVDTIKGTLAKHHLDPSELTLEMTETALIVDRSRMHATVTALAEAGASLSIDDFGTGYSSFAYLRYLPAKQIKVDRSFVAGLTTNTRDSALVAAVIGLAHEFGMTCVAEGVETAEQLERLRHLGCDLAQGYFLGRPAAAGDLAHAWQVQREKTPSRLL
jgi:diguanylate cyclase (GGDEF)-like protein